MKNNNLLFILVIIAILFSLISIAMITWNYKNQMKIMEFQGKVLSANQTKIVLYDVSPFLFSVFTEYHSCINNAIQNITFCLENQLSNCTLDFASKKNACEARFNEQINSTKIKT